VQLVDRTAEVLVVGAGPSGTAAAAVLARAGLDVLVVDKATFPRDKICGDGLTTAALRELDALGLDPAAVPSWIDIDDVVVRSPSGHQVTFPLPRDRGCYGAVARRRDLDAALVELARAAGATILEGAALRTAEVVADAGGGDQGVRAEVAGIGTVHAEWVVGADGMWSPLRRTLGLADPSYRGEWHAFRQYFRHVEGRGAHELFAWFEPDFLPGYAWSFPVGDGGANVGFGIMRDTGWNVGAMGQLWSELVERPHIRAVLGDAAVPEAPHRAWPIPARIDGVTLAKGRALFVGDAAAAADPLTGEGIGQALATGRWAAQAILDPIGAKPLGDLRPRHLIADGESQSAERLVTYVKAKVIRVDLRWRCPFSVSGQQRTDVALLEQCKRG